MPNAHGGFERVAHRGAPRECVENTLPAFLVALERGADAIELDVHATADGVVIVHHDDAVQGRRLAKLTWEDAARLDLGKGAVIPRLADVLDAIGHRAQVYIELKGAGIEERVIDTARQHGRRYAFHSFDHASIARVAELAPDIPRGILLDRNIPRPREQLRDAMRLTRPRDVWPHWSLVDVDLVADAHGAGARVITWTVNSGDIARAVLAAGVDGICTDDVRLVDAL